MSNPPTTDEELTRRVEALEDRADATDDTLASLDARVTALEGLVTTGEPPVIGGGPILPPDRPDHTLPVPEPQPPEPPAGSYVVIEFADRQLHYFNQEEGIDLGDYVDPKGRFTQRCIAVTNPAVPDFLVMFRPDVDGSREEIVFEFGRCHGNPAGSVLGAYTASICLGSNDTSIGINVPKHYYYSRWRWQSAPRPVTASVADLVAAKLVPSLDATLVPGMRAGVHSDDGPMQPNGITTYMATTGERDDIGILTESQADYLMHEDAQGLGTVRAWLEGSAAFPWHHRDEKTGAPLDFVTAYPGAGTCSSGAQPQIALYYAYEEDLWPDTSHAPDLAYVPFLLTGDPYALEELQFQATFDYVALGTKDFCMSGSLRSYAWHMRNVAHCMTATPAAVPSWLQPKEHWQAYLERALEYSLDNGPRKGADTWQQRFRDMSVGLNSCGEVAGLMEEYTMAVFLHMADLGIPGWDAMRDWKIPGVIARTNGTSGYNRSIPMGYVRVVTEGSPTAPVLADWAALQAWNAGSQGYYQGEYYSPNDPTQAHLATNNPTLNYGYITYTLACLNWAARQDVAEAAPCAAWLGPEMVGKIPYMRWAVG